ncbi:MAG: hypothetical protein C0411_01030 [Pseudomonas sp.]|nr:hypothetical protein [Pseudomonas sp.]
METKPDGGPAFPCSENGTSHTIAMAAMLDLPATASTDEKDKVYITTKANAMQGMSLRDYFAGKSIQGMLAALDASGLNYSNPTMMAQHAYAFADAMLAARSA